MLYGTKIEICAGSLEDIEIAEKYKEVDRIECNSHLEEEGLSMDHDDFLKARKISSKELHCMVRTRGGNFIYSDAEKEEMMKHAIFFLENGANGIVFGSLTDDHKIDIPFTKQLIDLAHEHHCEAIFHKAFDETDFEESIQTLISLHCDRILTSAGKPDCLIGMPIMQELQEKYGNQIQILPGGGINDQNVCQILGGIQCHRFHMSLRSANPEKKLIDVLEAIRSAHFSNHQRVLTGEDEELFENDTYEDHMQVSTETYEHE